MGLFENRYRRLRADFTNEVTIRPALRINTARTSPKELLPRLQARGVRLERIPYLRHGYWHTADFSLGSTEEYLLGYYFLQGALSQLVSEVLDPENGDLVLDMAAAPGAKTTHLAQLAPDATIVALDTNAQRLGALRNNCERLGLPNVIMVRKDARYAADLDITFDRVLLDAPCSGNFCSEPDWAEKRDLGGIKANARLQKELLRAAVSVLRPGGLLVYSTCSLEPEEDELLVDWAVQELPLHLEPIGISGAPGAPGVMQWDGQALNPSLVHTRRFWPQDTNAEGFFIAEFRKNN